MASISAGVIAGGLSAAGGLASGIIGSSAATDAANVQAQAANHAADLQFKEFGIARNELKPYTINGRNALTDLRRLTGSYYGGNPLTAPLTKPFQPTMAQLARTPGYQFTRQQGLLATQNSFASQGLGSSGAAMKGAANYAEGLASTTYQQQFQNYLGQNQQIYNMLYNQAGLGESAASMTGNQAVQTGANVGNLITGGAAATAGGIVGSANAITGGISSLANAGMLYGLTSGGMFGNQNDPNNTEFA